MVRLFPFPFLAKSRLFSLLICFELVVFGPVLLSAPAFAKNDVWMGCRGADLDARIVSCSQLITRGKRETKSDRITAYINRASGYRAKGDLRSRSRRSRQGAGTRSQVDASAHGTRVDLSCQRRVGTRHRGLRHGA